MEIGYIGSLLLFSFVVDVTIVDTWHSPYTPCADQIVIVMDFLTLLLRC